MTAPTSSLPKEKASRTRKKSPSHINAKYANKILNRLALDVKKYFIAQQNIRNKTGNLTTLYIGRETMN